MKLRIDNATIVSPGSTWHGKSPSITIQNGHVTAMDSPGEPAEVVWNAQGMRLSAGWCDMRAQFGDPGLEHKEDLESGCAAAAAGGFTQVCLLPNTQPVIQSKNDIQYLIAGNSRRVTQVRPLAAVTKDAKGEDFTDMLDLHAAGAAAFTDGSAPIWHTDILLKTLLYLQKIDALLINRPEDRLLTHFASMHEGITSTRLGTPGMPRLAETLIVQRDLQILRYTGGRLHFANVSTPESLSHIRQAKADGLQVTCDVAAYQLLWLDEVLEENPFDTHFKVNPPLREASDREALLQGLNDGTIDVLVTSHTPQDEESKKLEFDLADFGMTGLEMFLPMMMKLGEDAPEEVWIEKVTTNPNALLGQKDDPFAIDSLANFTVYNPEQVWKYDAASCKSKAYNHPWFGAEVTGKVKGAIYGNRNWSEDL
ncbi:MAG TPA: dihydroorotase [Cytophagales bacterium]|nr:dihydroorotase [Cytophagales bacterium]